MITYLVYMSRIRFEACKGWSFRHSDDAGVRSERTAFSVAESCFLHFPNFSFRDDVSRRMKKDPVVVAPLFG